MKTYLFVWNPQKWDWTSLDENIDQVDKTGRSIRKWSVRSHKKIQIGDRVFLFRLGIEPKGIMAAGFVSTKPFLNKHWGGEDKMVHSVMIDFEVILNPETDQLLTLDFLNQNGLDKVKWISQASGVEIPTEYVEKLEELWFSFLNTKNINKSPFKYSEINERKTYAEGTPNQVVLTKYERNPYARKACIDHYGFSCSICGFDFFKKYGEIGRGFIHVHHLERVADIGKERTINPVNDLRPVCPNCHAMIHKRKEPFTIEEIREMITNNL